MPPKCRLDERLVRDGLVVSRSLAQRLIMAGSVRVAGARVDKASQLVRDDVPVSVDAAPKFVSRGGDKLDNALVALEPDLERLSLTVDGSSAIDLGSSTGGFTDCLLQRGARRVIAVDVGYGQLDHRLRVDPRVTVLERTNARHLTPDGLPYPPDLITCDASFISLGKILPGPLSCMQSGWWGVLLCKPQFEAGRDVMRARTGGVIRDDDVRDRVVEEAVARVRALGIIVERVVEASPRGPKGNIEYALLVRDGT